MCRYTTVALVKLVLGMTSDYKKKKICVFVYTRRILPERKTMVKHLSASTDDPPTIL